MMVRYLALRRNMEEEPSFITERLWGRVKTKMDSVAEFIRDIQTDQDVVDGDHTDYTGLKIRCYIGGDPEGAYGIGNSFPNQSYHKEMQEYIAKLIGETETDYSDACKVATEKCEYTLVLLGVRVFKPNVNIKALESLASEQVGAAVKLEHDEVERSGWLKIKYYNADTLAGILDKLGIQYEE